MSDPASERRDRLGHAPQWNARPIAIAAILGLLLFAGLTQFRGSGDGPNTGVAAAALLSTTDAAGGDGLGGAMPPVPEATARIVPIVAEPTATPFATTPTPTPTPIPPTATPTPEATATPTATSTPEATATPVATSTPEATATPVATSTPEASATATPLPATATPAATATPVPPTATPIPPTPVPATATPAPTATALPVVVAPAPAPPAAVDTSNEVAVMVARLNQVRSEAGVGGLIGNATLDSYALAWSQFMSTQGSGTLYHSQNEPAFHLDSSAPGGCLPWGENVATGFLSSTTSLQNKLELSPGHFRNMIDARFDQVGIGILHVGNDIWITQVFGGNCS